MKKFLRMKFLVPILWALFSTSSWATFNVQSAPTRTAWPSPQSNQTWLELDNNTYWYHSQGQYYQIFGIPASLTPTPTFTGTPPTATKTPTITPTPTGTWATSTPTSTITPFAIPQVPGGNNMPLHNWVQVSVKEAPFYAYCDGVHDDTAAFNKAVQYVYSQGGGEVDIPAGTSCISSLAVTFGYSLYPIHLKGAGKRATILRKPPGSSDTKPFIYWSTYSDEILVTGSDISDMTIYGNGSGEGTGATSDGIDLVYTGDFKIQNVEVLECVNGIRDSGGLVFRVKDCSIRNNQDGFLFAKNGAVYPNLITVADTCIVSNSVYGVDFSDGSRLHLDGDDVESNGNTYTASSSGGLMFRSSIGSESAVGEVVTSYCWFESNNGYGINTESLGTNPINIILNQNTYISNTGSPVLLDIAGSLANLKIDGGYEFSSDSATMNFNVAKTNITNFINSDATITNTSTLQLGDGTIYGGSYVITNGNLGVNNGSVGVTDTYPGNGNTPAGQSVLVQAIQRSLVPVAQGGMAVSFSRIDDYDYASSLHFYTASDNTSVDRGGWDGAGNFSINNGNLNDYGTVSGNTFQVGVVPTPGASVTFATVSGPVTMNSGICTGQGSSPSTVTVSTLNLTSNLVYGGVTSSSTPTASAIPVADSGGTLNAWVNGGLPAVVSNGSVAFTGNQSMGGYKLTNLAAPVAGTDAADMSYVQSQVAGQANYHAPANFVAAAALPNSPTYTNSGSSTLIAGSNAPLTVDGTPATVANRILVTAQAGVTQNGMYSVLGIGGASTPWTMCRASDYDAAASISGAYCYISSGVTYKGSQWINTNLNTLTIGTTPITFIQAQGANNFTAANGVSLNGSQINLAPGSAASQIYVTATGAFQPTLVTPSGDVTLSATGAFGVTKISGATLGTVTAGSGDLLIGSGSQWASNAISGDVVLTSTGSTTVVGINGSALSSGVTFPAKVTFNNAITVASGINTAGGVTSGLNSMSSIVDSGAASFGGATSQVGNQFYNGLETTLIPYADTVFHSPNMSPTLSTFSPVSQTAYFVYLGDVQSVFTPKYVRIYDSTTGTESSCEVGIFTTPSAPNGANQTLTKVVSGTVTTSLSTGIDKNTSAFSTALTVGTHIWAGFVVAWTVQPVVQGMANDFGTGSYLTTTTAGTFASNTTFTGVATTTMAALTGVCPDLVMTNN